MTLPRTGLGSTSLGAVGGPRGVAAGGLRVLIEFISQYDPAAVKQLEADMASLEATQARLGNRAVSVEGQLERATRRRVEAENILAAAIANADKAEKARLTRAKSGIEKGLLGSRDQRKEARADFALMIDDLRRFGGLTDSEARKVGKLLELRSREKAALTLKLRTQQSITNATEQELLVNSQLSRFQALKAQLPSRLGGLALGALGGLVGGAVIGAGFAAAQAVIDRVGEALQDLVDPARHARENVKELVKQVDALVEQGKLSRLQALKQILAEVGIEVDDATARLLNEALGAQKANTAIEERIRLGEILTHTDELRKQNIAALEAALIREAYATGQTVETHRSLTGQYFHTINGVNVLTLATEEYESILENVNKVAREDVENKTAQIAATFALTLAQNNLNAAARAYTAAQTAPIDKQLDRLSGSDPTSARTRQLERQLENLQSGGGSNNSAALRQIAEERQLILLRQRLRLLGANIDLEKYSGKFLLEAIDAKLAALNKQAAAQDRLNRLMDLQFRISKGIQRQAGETINDFLERRAQEGRDILSEQRDIEREQLEEKLQNLKEKTEDEVALAELAERKKSLLAQTGANKRLEILQKELEKSREADRKALQSKIDALNKQKEELQQSAEDALKIATAEHQLELRSYIQMSNTMNELAALAGEIRGLNQAKEFLSAVLASGILPPEQAASVSRALRDIEQTLRAFSIRSNQIQHGYQTASFINKMEQAGFASGGFIPLNNASSPFGQNIRFGEEGSEAGLMVLPNKITQALKGSQGAVGSMNFYGVPNDDMQVWAYKIKNIVKETLREELRG